METGFSRPIPLATVEAPPLEEEDEWELRHDDDGFVYKILRRQGRIADATAAIDGEAAAVLEQRRRRERKRRALLNLKDKYQREIDQWGILSNTLKEMQERASLVESRPDEAPLLEEPGSPGGYAEKEGAWSEIDKLLAKVDVQEAMIQRVSNLCDIAEAMCKAQEERSAQSFLDLPIWSSSPGKLMASLCDE